MPNILTSQIPKPIDDNEFEELVKDLYEVKWKSNSIQIFGRSGQKQDGVDIYDYKIINNKLIVRAIQCKVRKSKLTNREILNEIKLARNFHKRINEYYIVTTLDRDTTLQKVVGDISIKEMKEGRFSVKIVFWQDLVSDLFMHKEIFYKYYGDFVYDREYLESSTAILQNENVHCRLLLGVVIDLSKNMLSQVTNNMGSVKGKNFDLAYKHVLFRTNAYSNNNLDQNDLSAMRLISIGLGLGNHRNKTSSLFSRLGLTSKKEYNGKECRDLFSELTSSFELPKTPTFHALKNFWPTYEKAISKHLFDLGGSIVDIGQGLEFTSIRFEKDVTKFDPNISIALFVFDESSLTTDNSNLEQSVRRLKTIGVKIFFVILSSKLGDSDLVFRNKSSCDWSQETTSLFTYSSEFDTSDSFDQEVLSIARENKIDTPENVRMFVILHHQSSIEKLIDLLVAPLINSKYER